ncbi:MAG TPA: hypothetical protein VHC72_13100 [Bryobacteraceae bacterium]|nr:hypothetical protein [Bryobacteraceae bacterium]
MPVRSGSVKKFGGRTRTNPEFRQPFADAITFTRIYNSYEMAEQVGIVSPQPVGVAGAVHASQVAR